MANFHASASFSGHNNQGFELGINSGHITNYYSGQAGLNNPPRHEPFSTTPFSQDPDFVDRGDVLDQLHERCSHPAARVALVGLGGVGKSQVAIQYSYQVRERFPQIWVFWVHGSNGARFEQSYKVIADRLGLPGRDDPQVSILQLVTNWLCEESDGRWVMIVDNADDATTFFGPALGEPVGRIERQYTTPPSLASFLPQSQNGCILFTSRSEHIASRLTGGYKNIIKLEAMANEEGLSLLGKKVDIRHNDKDAASELLQGLDYMPLAITQAAAFINRLGPRGSITKYLENFHKSDKSKASLLNKDEGDLRRDSSASNSVIITWQISFDQIRKERPAAAELLSLLSFFDRQGIPEFVLRSWANKVNDKAGTNLELDFEEDLATLRGYCLIATNIEGKTFEMHRLVQFTTKRWLEAFGQIDGWRRNFLTTLSVLYPHGEFEQWRTCEVLFPHAEAAEMDEPEDEESLQMWSYVLDRAAWYALQRGRYDVGERLVRKAISASERTMGCEHAAILNRMHTLATTLMFKGNYEVAEEICRRCLDGREQRLGKEDCDTFKSMHTLVQVLLRQGKYDAAEKMGRQALNGYENSLGKDHYETLSSMEDLADIFRHQDKYEAAEKLIRQVLDRREKLLGKENPATLRSMGSLEMVLSDQGKYEAAEEMIRRVLIGMEKIFGEKHPNTLRSMGNLVRLLGKQGKHEAAEEMGRRALNGMEKVLGRKHPDTLISMGN